MPYDPILGMKVVCIDDRFDPAIASLYTMLPVMDSTYVIREVRLGVKPEAGKFVGDISITLIGLVNPVANSKSRLERGFSADRFRPLDELRDEAKRSNVYRGGRTLMPGFEPDVEEVVIIRKKELVEK